MSTIGDIAGKPKSKIKIKPSHRGLLHKKLNVPQGQPIPQAKGLSR